MCAACFLPFGYCSRFIDAALVQAEEAAATQAMLVYKDVERASVVAQHVTDIPQPTF